MQFCRISVALLLLVAGATATVSTSEATAESHAAQWLRDHPQAQADELAELKSENPGAYAMVKALLTKRSLGLLNPHHPTASFSAPAQPEQGAEQSGSAAYSSLVTKDELEKVHADVRPRSANLFTKSTALYPEVSASHANHDWLNWKPQQSALDDETLVSNVLGAVAELKGKKIPAKGFMKHRSNDANVSPLAAEEAAFSTEASSQSDDSASRVPVQAEQQPASMQEAAIPATTGQVREQPAATPVKTDVPAVLAPSTNKMSEAALPTSTEGGRGVSDNAGSASQAFASASESPLAAFDKTFGGDDDASNKKVQPQSPKPAAATSSGSTSKDALLSWLGGGNVKRVEQPKKVEEKNPYAVDWNV